MKTLVLLPTSHKFQRGRPYCTEREEFEFCEKVRELCSLYGLTLIGEEFHESLTVGEGKTGTTCREVALALGLDHVYCEPPAEERVLANVKDPQSIKIMKILGQLTSSQAGAERKRNFNFREAWWLRTLIEKQSASALFVFGADHVKSFTFRAWKSGVGRVVLVSEWPPN